MKKTATALGSALALIAGLGVAPAAAQDAPTISIGEPGSALAAVSPDGSTHCGTAYIGEFQDGVEAGVPEGSRAIAGLEVTMESHPGPEMAGMDPLVLTVESDENGRYCFDFSPIFGGYPSMDPFGVILWTSFSQEQVDQFNTTSNVGQLDLVEQSWSGASIEDPISFGTFARYQEGANGATGVNTVFSLSEPAPEEDSGNGSLPGFGSSEIVDYLTSVPTLLLGMLHGGGLGS